MKSPARPDSPTDRPRPARRSRLALLALGVVLAGSIAPAATQPADELFDHYEVVTGSAPHQTVVPGFFLGGALADLAVVHVDENGERRLRIYAFGDGDWEPRLDATLGPEVSFVDVAHVGGRDLLITHERGHLRGFDPETATEKALVEVAVNYRATDKGRVPRVDITRDVNRDGRDDLVVPDVDGFWVSTQRSDGSFTEAVKLGPPEPFRDELVGGLDFEEPGLDRSSTYGDVGITAATVPVYLSRVHEMDYDRDGLSDLVFWNRDHFEVHRQDERGRFDPEAETFTTDVPFDSDGAYSRALEYRDQGVFSAIFGTGKKTERTVLHSFRDLNGDGVADLVTLTLAGRSITRQRSLYEVHFGTPTAGGTAFARDAGTAIRPRGRAAGMQPWGYSSQRFEDLDGDGQVELMLQDVKVGIGGMMRALVGNSVPIDLEFFRGDAGAYPDEPTTTRKIRRFAPFAGIGNVFFPPVLTGDVNGDGRSDLVVGHGPDELHVYFGVPGPDLFERRPQKVDVDLPSDERNTWLVDLDRNGKQDVLIHRGPTGRAPDEPHRLTTLIAR